MKDEGVVPLESYTEECLECHQYRHVLKLSDGRTLYAFSDRPDAEVTFIDSDWECSDCQDHTKTDDSVRGENGKCH